MGARAAQQLAWSRRIRQFRRLTNGTVGSPAFAVYLLAVALLPFRWLSPIGWVYENADWTDVLIGVSALLWLCERMRHNELRSAHRTWYLPLALYLLLALVSALVATSGRALGIKTGVLMAELAILAVITADVAADVWRRRIIARVIVTSSLVSVLLGALGLILFYAHVRSGLIGPYGDL